MRPLSEGVKLEAGSVDGLGELRYAGRVAKVERVVLADTAADHPAPFGTVAIALAALCAGFASAYALRDRDGADDVEHASAVETVALPATATPRAEAPVPLAAEQAPSPSAMLAAAEPVAEQPAPAQPPPAEPLAQRMEPSPPPEPARAIPPAEPPPAPAPAAAIAARREEPRDDPGPRAGSTVDPFADQRLKPGIVAYLRCDGVPQVKGPFPCPRDRGLERRVWNALRSLERCAPLVDARGASEIRLELTPLRTEVHVIGGELDRSAVRQCAAGLASARTALRPTKMIVAFRFELH